MAIVQLDKILSGVSGNLEHVRVYEDIATKKLLPDFTNGIFVVAKGIEEGNREVREAELADATDNDILLVHVPELMYDEKIKLRDFKVVAGTVSRAYRPQVGDIVTYTVDILPAGIKVGDKLTVTAGKLGIEADTQALTDATLVFEVIEDSGNELDAEVKAFAIQVIQKG